MANSLVKKSAIGLLLLGVMAWEAGPATARGALIHQDTALSDEPEANKKPGWVYAAGAANKDGETNHILYIHDEVGHGVLFRCQGKILHTTFMIEPGDFRETRTRRATRVRKKSIEVSFPDNTRLTAPIYYFPSSRTALVKDRTLVARVFKSAVSAETIGVEVSQRDAITFTFPARNAAFSAFAEGCPLIK